MAILRVIGFQIGIDKHIIGVVVGLLSQAFATLVALIAFVPFVGPIIAKVLALPFIKAHKRYRLPRLDYCD